MNASPTAAPTDRVTFVIATRNRRAELTTVVDRLIQTTACPIIVVDNGSEDGSVARLHKIGRRTDRLSVLSLGHNAGAVARNIGVQACRTPYVAFCDDDSWWAPDAPTVGARIFDEHPDVGLLAARTVVWPSGHEDPLVARLANSPLPRRAGLPGRPVLGFLACSAMVRRGAFQAAGGFSPILHFRGEEQLLAMDLAALNWELCYCPELTAIHQPSPLRAPTTQQDARTLRNAALTSWLRRPGSRCVRPAAALLRSAGRDRAHARAAAEAITLLPGVIRQRRRLPTQVETALRLLE